MKTTLSLSLAAVALFAGTAMAGTPPISDAPRDEMRADTDHDGRVSRAEYDAAASQRRSDWFDKLDLNKDGYITQDEMQQARETPPQQDPADDVERRSDLQRALPHSRA